MQLTPVAYGKTINSAPSATCPCIFCFLHRSEVVSRLGAPHHMPLGILSRSESEANFSTLHVMPLHVLCTYLIVIRDCLKTSSPLHLMPWLILPLRVFIFQVRDRLLAVERHRAALIEVLRDGASGSATGAKPTPVGREFAARFRPVADEAVLCQCKAMHAKRVGQLYLTCK